LTQASAALQNELAGLKRHSAEEIFMNRRLYAASFWTFFFVAVPAPSQNLRSPPDSQNLRTPPDIEAPSAAQIAELVLANHILANEGVIDAYGHVSVRSEQNPSHFLLGRHLPAGVMTAADILEYDLDTKPVQDTNATGYSERFIHGEIYKARPDVKAVIHLHSPDVIPFTVTSVPLRPMIHMAGFLPEVTPIFEIRKAGGMTDMLIRTNELGHALAQTLGDKPLVLLRGHGAVVVADSLHIAVGRAYYLGINARTQLQAIQLGAGKVTYLDPEEGRKTGDQDGYERAWTYWRYKLQDKK
jgi:ribulose-5-phosphate 4-epimerase/fuculose-1-phosphate aldolase